LGLIIDVLSGVFNRRDYDEAKLYPDLYCEEVRI
jgi:hypothetical protein